MNFVSQGVGVFATLTPHIT